MFEQVPCSRAVFGDGSSLLLCADASRPLPALKGFTGQARAVFMDPPFMTGEHFTRKRPFGERGWQFGRPLLEWPAYDDRFPDLDSYLLMLRGLCENARALLSREGVLLLHIDWRVSAHARLLCDELFGPDRFVNEIIWAYESGGRAKRSFSRKHDTILIYSLTRDYVFVPERAAVLRSDIRRNHLKRCIDEEGRTYGSVTVRGKEYRYYDDDPVCPSDVWTDISHLQQRDPERTGFPTQKPLRLLRRLLSPFVEPGALVADLCCGSGTSLEAAQSLKCRFLGCDLSPDIVSLCQTRAGDRNVTVDCPASDTPAALYGSLEGGVAFILTGFEPADPRFPVTGVQPLDALESWACGHLRDGVFIAESSFRRSLRTPALPPMSFLPEGDGDPAVLTIDAAGVRRVYRWHE